MIRICAAATAVLMLALTITAPAPASAEFLGPNDFMKCDGYNKPSSSYDKFSREPGWVYQAVTNKQGIAFCEAALKDPVLIPHRARRINLLTVLAANQLAATDSKAALATLDKADAEAALITDPLFKRTLGLKLILLRALALRAEGDMDAARKFALTAVSARPYALSISQMALIALGPQARKDIPPAIVRGFRTMNPQGFERSIDLTMASIIRDEAKSEAPYRDAADSIVRAGPSLITAGNLPKFVDGCAISLGKPADERVVLLGRGSGAIEEKGNPFTTVHVFEPGATSMSDVEEIALLRAAERAIWAGKSTMLVTGRRSNSTEFVDIYGGGYSQSVSRFSVYLLKPGELPPGYEDKADWLLDVREVYAQLSPIFPGPTKPTRCDQSPPVGAGPNPRYRR